MGRHFFRLERGNQFEGQDLTPVFLDQLIDFVGMVVDMLLLGRRCYWWRWRWQREKEGTPKEGGRLVLL